MLLVKTKVKKSPIHGDGLFADEDVKEGQVIWEYNDSLDGPIKKSVVRALTAPQRKYLREYGTWDGDQVYLDGDDAIFMNHSREPNLRTGPGRESMFALRSIKKGEELTCDYREFDDPSREGKEPYV